MWVARVFYRFPDEATLRVGRRQVRFSKGDRVQILESRRYSREGACRLLREHGLAVLGIDGTDTDAVFRCAAATGRLREQ